MNDFTFMLEQGMRAFSTKGGFLTVKCRDQVNTMTISWGFIGFMWGNPHFIAVVRPQRYTNELLAQGVDCFTVSTPLDGALSEELSICGTKSGRDIDKRKVVTFIPGKAVDCPVVEGCGLYYECKINLAQQMDGSLLADNILKQFYQDDYHFMYIGEIVEIYTACSKSS